MTRSRAPRGKDLQLRGAVGLVPDGVRSVEFERADGTTVSIPVARNLWAVTEADVERGTFTPRQTGRELLVLQFGLSARASSVRAEERLTLVELTDAADRRIKGCSGGMSAGSRVTCRT